MNDGESEYEEPTRRYQNTVLHVYDNARVGNPSRRPSTKSTPGNVMNWTLTRWIVAFICFVIVIGLLVAILITASRNAPPSGLISSALSNYFESENEWNTRTAETCRHLRKQGQTRDGIYVIQPNGEEDRIYVYCDMTTDGGGWTMVASINDKNISKKCAQDDNWSFYAERDDADKKGENHWVDTFTFGNLFFSITDDYKNRGYFALNASDVMLWHVSPKSTIHNLKAGSRLRYRTTNGFLRDRVENLRSVFQEFPLRVESEKSYGNTTKKRTDDVIVALSKKGSDIKKHIPDWHEYLVPQTIYWNDTMLKISSSVGVTFRNSRCYLYLRHAPYSRCYPTFSYTRKTEANPLLVVGVFTNPERINSYYELKISFERANSTDEFSYIRGQIIIGNHKLQYQLLQFSNALYPTVSNFHFIVTNQKDWNSMEPSSITVQESNSIRSSRYSEVRYDGFPVNFVMGGVLLSRENGKLITTTQADSVGREILSAIASVSSLFQEYQSPSMSLSVPVVFDKGTTHDVINMVPPDYRSSVEPGYLQFRPMGVNGFSRALCPGIKASKFPEYVCVGGFSDSVGDHGTCGDFGGWEGLSSDIVHPTRPNGSAHSQEDILSTIFIFYR